jgi:hypothetical protein
MRSINRIYAIGALGFAIFGVIIVLLVTRTSHPKVTGFLPKSPEPTAVTTARTSASPSAIVSPSPEASGAMSQSVDGHVTIESPAAGTTITSGSTVSGKVTLAGGQLYYRVKGGKSGQLALGPVQMTAKTNAMASYTFSIAFSNQVNGGTDDGELEVYILKADGSVASTVSIAVKIQG